VKLVFAVLIATIATAVAAARAAVFAADPRAGWVGLAHDRNGHYEFAQQLSLAIRAGRPDRFLATLDLAKIWPPLHGLCAAAVLVFTGPDFRFAIAPSLVGWILLATIAFLLARDLDGSAAGALAAAFVIASPAYGRFSVDVMLESLGAALTMLTVWLYVRAQRGATIGRWRAFAIALTLLFFEKYNYWLLAAAGIAIAHIVEGHVRGRKAPFTSRDLLRAALDRKSIPLAAAVLAPLIVWWLHPPQIAIAGRSVSLYPPNNLITVAWAVLCWRFAVEWRARALRIDDVFTPAAAAIVRWHVVPIAVSFLFPRRLSAFMAHLVGSTIGPPRGVAATAAYYARAATFDYHAGWMGRSIAVILVAAVAIALWRRREGPATVALSVWLVGIGAALVYPHGSSSRFLHSFFALGWIAGAIACSRVLQSLRIGRRAAALITAAAAVAVATEAPVRGIARWQEDASHGPQHSALDITDAYLHRLGDSRHIAVTSTAFAAQLARWTYRDRYRRRDGIECPIDGGLAADTLQAAVQRWLLTTEAEAVVFIDVPPGSPDYVPVGPYDAYAGIGALIDRAPRFVARDRIVLPERATITIWRRRPPPNSLVRPAEADR
jgi:hypothetical protein